ncbi:MAG TPA: DUF4815 domain-containing protein, partial [Methanosarcina sp.]|nr:DUF4815 domain-containing protein [Methanosarcina sp.]
IDFRPTKTGTNSFSATNIPAMGFDIIADYTYYLPRVDKISLSSKGDFVLTSGVPAEVPSAPSDPENSMLLYTTTIYPSIVDTPTVVVSRQDNRRYTMRDIGALDSRLSNVEYYTSLSLLESQTNNLQLFDNQGNVSFKNGFIVDNLSDQSIGDTTSSEYRCSVDISKGELHPSFYKTNLKVFEKAASNADRLSSGYVLQNNVATLPYTTTPFAYQPYASTMENVTPYIKLDFVGDLKLNPSSDEWFDTSYRPDVVLNLEGNFDALVNQYKSQLGTVWNDWQTTWAGNPRRFGDGLGNFGINQEVRQTRTGTNTYVKPVYQSTLIGDRIVSVDIIPFIRPRTISFYGSGFKPTTRVYSFFDQTNVDAYVTPARKITLTSKTGIFDTNTQSGASSDLAARSIASKNDAVSVGLSMGDIIHNGASGNLSLATATAIVKIDEDDGVRVINLRGTFTPGQTVYGTISGATGVVYSVETNPSLVTNIYGEIAGTFDIPSNSNIRFRTGTRNFTISDSATNGNDYTTFATTSYVATGYMNNRERTIVSSRNGVLAQEKV